MSCYCNRDQSLIRFSRFDTVSRSQRSLVAECERQQSRLIRLLRWYDHQRAARSVELRRQSQRLDKEVRQRINTRSKMVIKERARLNHILDDDNEVDRTELFHLDTSTSLFQSKDPIEDRKRKIYGCQLPQFKARLTRSSESWAQYRSQSTVIESEYTKRLEKQRDSLKRFLPSPLEQRDRMNTVMSKCLYELEECEGLGYDHFLKTCDPKRNAQVLAQRILNDKNQSQYR